MMLDIDINQDDLGLLNNDSEDEDEKLDLEDLQEELGIDFSFIDDTKLLDASKNVQHSKTNPRMLMSNGKS